MLPILETTHSFETLCDFLGNPYPWLFDLENTPQDNVWHAEGNVAVHTNMVLEKAYETVSEQHHWSNEQKTAFILGAFFHDVGKKKATKEVFKNNRICIGAPRHEQIGFNYLYFKIKDDPKLSYYAEDILKIVGYHNIPKKIIIDDMSYWQLLELRYKFNPEVLYLFSQCDFLGRHSDDTQEQLEYVELFKEQMKYFQLWQNDFNDPIETMFQSYPEKERNFLYQKAMSDLKNGIIQMPEEAVSKYYQQLDKGFGQLHIMCGLSGSGKSNFINNTSWDRIVSLDEIRKTFTKDPLSRKFEGQTLQEAKRQVKEGLAKNEVVCYDATNIREDFRNKLINLANAYNAFWKVHFINTSPKECIKNDKSRSNGVGQEIILNQSEKFEHPFF